MTTEPAHDAHHDTPPRRGAELAVFFVLAVVIWPLISIAIVGGYGFLVWIFQILTGPPGPPG